MPALADDRTPKRARLIMEDRNVDLQEGVRVRSARRKLFPTDDDENGKHGRELKDGVNENNANQFYEEVRKHREAAKKRWNFDFEKETPLPGRYEWIKLDRDGNELPTTDRTSKLAGDEEECATNEGRTSDGEVEEEMDREARENSRNS